MIYPFVLSFDLVSDFGGQLDGRGRHHPDHQRSDGPVDGRPAIYCSSAGHDLYVHERSHTNVLAVPAARHIGHRNTLCGVEYLDSRRAFDLRARGVSPSKNSRFQLGQSLTAGI
jgi:hypothetical protein